MDTMIGFFLGGVAGGCLMVGMLESRPGMVWVFVVFSVVVALLVFREDFLAEIRSWRNSR